MAATEKRTRKIKGPDLTSAAIASDRRDAGLLDKKGQLPRDLKIVWKSITDVHAYPNNPRQNHAAIEDVRDSLTTFGWQQPLVVDMDGVIIVGHTRYYAALDLRQSHVPVYVASLSDEKARAYRLADNKTGERAEWDFPKLAAEFKDLGDLGVDLKTTGFRDFEWAPIMAAEWAPGPAGSLGGESRGGHAPAPGTVHFDDRQLAIVDRAVMKYRESAHDECPSLPEAIVRILALYAKP